MAKQPLTPQQQAQSIIDAEKRAAQVAVALEKLRNQLDPTREATAKLAEAQAKSKATAEKVAGSVQGVFGAMQSIASLGGTPTGLLSAFGGQMGRLLGTLGPAGVAAGSFVNAAFSLPQLFKSAADSVSNYVAAFSPLSAERYSRAWKDLTASIGQMLLPVLNAATSVVRYFGDTIAGLTPVIRPVIEGAIAAVKPVFQSIGSVVRDTIRVGVVFYETFKPIGAMILNITTYPLQKLIEALTHLSRWLTTAVNTFGVLLGVDLPKFEGSSQGKAATSTGMTNVSSMLDDLRRKAYQLGGGGLAESPEKQQVALQLRIAGLLSSFTVENVAVAVGAQVAAFVAPLLAAASVGITKAIGDLPAKTGKAVAEAIQQGRNAVSQTQAGAAVAGNVLGFGGIPLALPGVTPFR